jgi:ureidoacrylate peracid hydrolase
MHKLVIDPWFIDSAKAARGGRLNAYQTLHGPKTALVVVDMQNYFVQDGMPSCVPLAREIVPNINRLARATRESGGLVIWIQTESLLKNPDDWANRKEATRPEGWNRRQRLLDRAGAGFPIYETCDVKPEDKIALKTRYSAFIPYPSDIEHLLKAHGIDTLLITGTATSTCCESTARDASMWGYRTIMVSDGNADSTDSLHNHTLGKFLVTFGDVQSTDEVIALLSAGRNDKPKAQARKSKKK